MSTAGFFVTGCDPYEHRTRASCELILALRREGIDVGAMKPIETGCSDLPGRASAALTRAVGGGDAAADVCPFPFELDAAPAVAARTAGRPIDLEHIEEAFARIAGRRAAVVVEGAGGLLSAISDGTCMAELAGRLRLPLILVEPARAGAAERLDLAAEAAMARGLEIAGVILCSEAEAPSKGLRAEMDWLRQRLAGLLLGSVCVKADLPAASLEVDRLLFELR